MARRPAEPLSIAGLTCIPGGAAGAEPDAAFDPLGAWGPDGHALWPAWAGMAASEMHVYEELGEEVGEKLLVLWAISRFRDSREAPHALRELVDETGRPRFGDPLVEDMMLAAFALGAAWGAQRGRPARAEAGPRLRLRKGHGELRTRGA